MAGVAGRGGIVPGRSRCLTVSARPDRVSTERFRAVSLRWGAAKKGRNSMDSDLEAEHESGYAIKVGNRLRSIRRQKHLSLQDVEAASEHEFKASVLGAYERGERAISVPRLQRLARFYRVPVDQMLPTDEELGGRAPGDESVVDLTERLRGARRDDRPVTIDLTAVE